MIAASRPLDPGHDALLERLLPLEPWLPGDSPEASERQQARVRIALGAFGVLLAVALGAWTGQRAMPVLAALAVQLALAVAWPLLLRRRPAPSRARRAFTILLDNLVPSFVASLGGVWMLWIAVHFWVVVGYGLRFGPRYLVAATAVALAGMIYNVAFTPHWAATPVFAATLILALAFTAANGLIVLHHLARAEAGLRARAEEHVRLAWQDQLTGLPNRRPLYERLAHAIALGAREHRPLALLLFDIDGFKAVNDDLGHEAGDEVLREIANRVGARVRASDTFARLGGDEFVILVETARRLDDAIAVARAVLDAVGGIAETDGRPVRIGASVGVAWFAADDALPETPDAMVAVADRAMYTAKRAGKHRYCIARTSRALLRDMQDA
jgi:diguanylate cyclase (GGDEF)-like protein